MEIRQLTYFVTVAEELSFGRAAQRLQLVQPAVSQQIRRLERELGVPLFDRSSRHVRLTAAGECLLPEVRAVLAAAARARQVAAGIAAGTDGILRVGTSQGLGERLDHILEQLRKIAPGLRVRLVSAPVAERITRVRAGELDAAFVRAVTAAPGLELLPLWQDPLTIALPATHPLAAQPAIQLPQLSSIPLRLAPREDNPPFHDLIVGACADAGFQPLHGPPFTTPQDALAEIGTGTAHLDCALHRRRRPDTRAPGGVPPTCRAHSANLPRGGPRPARPSPAAPARCLRIGRPDPNQRQT